ncbi:MFS transporter [Mucilaginibacter sp.]|uniref:MFS transporter n=1 Tax=Mucilaginibacter sp. TaxID=1882438 RepID=UPI0025EE26B9|nr:MFS transporter [Mucilaginibacter sp.]
MPAEKLPFSKQIAYACGMIGWSIMTNIVLVMLPYFYLAPARSGLIPFMPQVLFLGINVMSVILASGRIFDAFSDPYIASLSDKSRNPKGRRIPFMKWTILPAVIFCGLVFFPIVRSADIHNAYWLLLVLAGFYMCTTAYIIPYNALLPELTDTADEKVKLSSFQQVGFVIGIIISALVNNFADLVQHFFAVVNRDSALQYTIWGLCLFAGLVMLVPVLAINESRYVVAKKPSHLPVLAAIKKTFSQRNFKYYLISDFSFYMALSIISSGLLFFITVLVPLDASMGGLLMGIMVIASLCHYPLINYISKKKGKKPLVLFSFGLLALIFAMIFFLGKTPLSPEVQVYVLVICASFPLAALGILPNAILAEIAEKDAADSGENHEGMFFAVKYLFVKLGQTLGMALFAFLTVFGTAPGHDFGLRLNGICGFVLCLIAFLFFTRFREKKPRVKKVHSS